jgi:putative proteasome-type protease
LRATLIVGGQIGGRPPEIYMVYPEGNYVAATWETPYLQLGEFKYGKPILSRLAGPDLSLDDAARLALISFDAAMKSNLSVGPPLELAIYPQGAMKFSQHLSLEADSPLLRSVCRRWNEKLTQAFRALPRFDWERSGPVP